MKKLFKQICLFIVIIFMISELPILNVQAAERNSSIDTATSIQLNKEYTDNIERDGQKKYYKVVVSNDGELTVNLKHELIPGEGITYFRIVLLDSNNRAYLQTSSEGKNESVSFKTGLAKGTYYIYVERSSYYATIDYSLSVSLKSSQYYEKESNNSMSTANLINIGKEYTGKLANGDDDDYYKVVIPNDGEVSLNFKHELIPGASAILWKIKLLDSNNKVYMEADITGNEDNVSVKRGLPKGTYYVYVDRASLYDDMDYKISVSLKSSEYYEKEFNDTMVTANAIKLGKAYTGKISNWGDEDYYKFEVPEDGEVSLKFNHKELAGGSNTYWDVKVLDSKNNVYMKSSISADDNNIYLKNELKKGTYYVHVDRWALNTSDYNILVNLNVKSIKLNKTSLSLEKGKTSTLTTTIAPNNATNKNLTWTSSNTKVATVDTNGKVTAVGVGTANITAKAKDGSGKTAVCKVTVKDPIVKVTSIKLNKTSLSLEKGKTSTLTTTIAPSNATNKSVTWTSSNTKVATVDVNGKVTAVAAGTVNITAKAKDGSGKTAICKVTVNNPVKVTSIKLNKTSLSLEKGKVETLIKTIAPTNASNKNVTWTSSNTKVATVDANGKVTAVGVGTANITAKAKDGSGKSAVCKVTVKNPTIKITSLKLSKTSLSLQKGKTSTLTKTIAPSNATNKNVIWASSNPAVATVDQNGKIKAVGVGTSYIICATNDGSDRSSICKVTVKK